MGGQSRCVRYGAVPLADYMKIANDETCLCVQLETKEGIENIDAILSVKGVDLVTTGASDLSQSLGVPGRTDHPSVIEAQNSIFEAARRHGIPLLLTANTPAQGRELTEKGVYLQTICFDNRFIMKKLQELVATFRA